MTTRTQMESTNWYNTDPYKLIGHTVCDKLDNGDIIESGIVHKFNKADGKPAGSTNTAIAGPYIQTEKSVVQGYVPERHATNRFLEENDLRHKFGDAWYRPAKPDEVGYVLSGEDFRTWNESVLGWTYADIKPGHCLWIEDEDQSDPEEVELTEEEQVVVNHIADVFAGGVPTDKELDTYVRDEIKQRARIKAAVLRARGEA